MRMAATCMKLLSQRKHSVWLQKLSETTYVKDIQDLKDSERSHIPPKFWRGKVRTGKWHYGTYTQVLNALVDEALPPRVILHCRDHGSPLPCPRCP